jgi:hypothetical protein
MRRRPIDPRSVVLRRLGIDDYWFSVETALYAMGGIMSPESKRAIASAMA